MVFIREKRTAFCSSFNPAQRFSSSFWDFVRVTGSSSPANNWERVMPNAVQIFFREATVGSVPLQYQEDMVDWGRPDCSAS